ncbi:MAG: hypothetical protein IKI03_06880, partial [Clostridia bacterium]|nr:hypothetical protein [Clostridia bacterium]
FGVFIIPNGAHRDIIEKSYRGLLHNEISATAFSFSSYNFKNLYYDNNIAHFFKKQDFCKEIFTILLAKGKR